MHQNVELLYALQLMVALLIADIASIIMRKHGWRVKHELTLALNVLIITAMIVTASISHYLIGYDLSSSAPGYVAIVMYVPLFLLTLIVINSVRFITDA